MRTLRLLLLALLAVPVAQAATYVVPPDDILVGKAGAVVTARVLSAHPRFTEIGEIETVYTLAVTEVLKGQVASERIELVEWGGHIGDVWMAVSGGPQYEVGQDYAIFMIPNRNGEWSTLDLSLGRFHFGRNVDGRELLVRGDELVGWDMDGAEWNEPVRLAKPFLDYVRGIARGEAPAADYFVGEAPRRPRQILSNVSTSKVEPHTDLDFEGASNVGLTKWVSHGSSVISYSMSASPASANTKDVFDSEDRFIEDDPGNYIGGSFGGSGVVATAFYGGGGNNNFNGQSYVSITGSDIVLQDNVKSSNFTQEKLNSVMVHEVGHTLGFRHSNQSAAGGSCVSVCASTTIMNSSVVTGLNGVLQPWDSDAANEVYGDGSATANTGHDYVTTGLGDFGRRPNTSNRPWRLAAAGCVSPSISTQPANKTIAPGASASLSVTATGSGLSYQWYNNGTPGDDNPADEVGSNSASFNTGAITLEGIYPFWVKITGECGSVNSNLATVTVECVEADITSQPKDKTITAGNSTTLSVSASGTGLSYQWYKGVSGNTSNPTGSDSKNLVVSPSVNTDYWVRVTADCGDPVDSNTATVTVEPASCNLPVITTQPVSQSIDAGGSATLSLAFTGSGVTVRWFTGPVGDETLSTQIATGTSVTVGPLVTTTLYWAKLTNSCGSVFTDQVTITVGPTCTAPAIVTPPLSQEIGGGQTVILSVIATGTETLSYQWFEGETGDESKPVAEATSNTFVTGKIYLPTTFWVRVSNDCGAAVSETVVISVRKSRFRSVRK